MRPTPCPLCGYDAQGTDCPHCHLASTDPSFEAPAGPMRRLADGATALFRGLALLAGTSGVKRFLVPPAVLTFGFFVGAFLWVWSWIESFIEAVRAQDVSTLNIPWGWLETAVGWLLNRGLVIWLAKQGVMMMLLFSSTIVALWTFSILYEAICGPFLDEIQGRIEKRWFGRDPRNALHRPNAIPVKRCWKWSLTAGAVAVLALWFAWVLPSPWFWLALTAAPAAFIAAGFKDREYGEWLWWVVRLESKTLWVSVKASLIAGFLMLMFFWVRFIPIAGYVLFALLTGFCTAVTLLDIPFSRRQWSLSQRLQFTLQNFLPTVAFGFVASLFFLVPIIGPLIAVPGASIGGLWLVCRLDKNAMRPLDRKLARPRTAALSDPA